LCRKKKPTEPVFQGIYKPPKPLTIEERIQQLSERLPTSEPLHSPDRCVLTFRLQFGERLTWSWNKKEHHLGHLFDFIDYYLLKSNSSCNYNFVGMYPRREWERSQIDIKKSIEVMGFCDQDTIYVTPP